jgi:hypothetical protein
LLRSVRILIYNIKFVDSIVFFSVCVEQTVD